MLHKDPNLISVPTFKIKAKAPGIGAGGVLMLELGRQRLDPHGS